MLLQGRSGRDTTVPLAAQDTAELYIYQCIQVDWLGPQPPSVSEIVSGGRCYFLPSCLLYSFIRIVTKHYDTGGLTLGAVVC